MIDILQLQKFIPHRFPFLLVDRVLSITTNESIKAIKNVSINEWFFQGHFPNSPVMPGVLIVEALAQAAGIFMGKSMEDQGEDMSNKLMFFMSIDNVKFRQVVTPGDQLILDVMLTQKRAKIAKFEAKASVNEKVVVEADFMAMITEQ